MVIKTDLKQSIEVEIENIKKIAEKFSVKLTDDQAFNVLILQYYCFKESELEEIWFDLKRCITDSPNDGGLDFVYFDEEESKIIIGQNKYSTSVTSQDLLSELHKIIATIQDFNRSQTGKYNPKVKEEFQNALDRLTDETDGNIEVIFATPSKINTSSIENKLQELENKVSQILILNSYEIVDTIDKTKSRLNIVKEDVIEIDNAGNILRYENEKQKGIFVNISSKSLTKLYNKYNNGGLFNLNIRRYIRNKNVDEGIIETLNKKREEFWFLNNGLTIACEDFMEDGNTVKLYGFSIVNGGQTTKLIGDYKGSNNQEFFIPCKIVSSKEKMIAEDAKRFFNRIAEATNSQKPIQPRDLKSNAPEMINLQRLLLKNEIALQIKRGEDLPKSYKYRINNDLFAQLIYSFVNQKPGTARSNKRSLFANNKPYKEIFRKNYSIPEKTRFIVDLIELNDRFEILSKKYKRKGEEEFTPEEANIFANSKYVLFALFGVIYRIVNKDISINEIRNDPYSVMYNEFIYDSFISNYKNDDIDNKIDTLIKYLISILQLEYEIQYRNENVTSVSNFFKTDKKYIGNIVKAFVYPLNRKDRKNELLSYGEIFLRK